VEAMSTRKSIVLAEAKGVVAHLYREMHDDAVHLELGPSDERVHASINVVVPGPLVDGVAEMLRRSEVP
jgi:hypothetical protein